MKWWILFAMVMALLTLTGCTFTKQVKPEVSQTTGVVAPSYQRTLYVFGDSLSAGYRLPIEQSYPMVVEQMLRERGYNIRVINAGESWDTSAGLRERLEWVIADAVTGDLALVVIGWNDGLQWLSTVQLEDNLTSIIQTLQDRGLSVIVGGMQLPTNLWTSYRSDFAAVYPRVASGTDSSLIPFILTGVGWVPELNLSDGIHPNASGQVIVAQTVVDFLMNNEILAK